MISELDIREIGDFFIGKNINDISNFLDYHKYNYKWRREILLYCDKSNDLVININNFLDKDNILEYVYLTGVDMYVESFVDRQNLMNKYNKFEKVKIYI